MRSGPRSLVACRRSRFHHPAHQASAVLWDLSHRGARVPARPALGVLWGPPAKDPSRALQALAVQWGRPAKDRAVLPRRRRARRPRTQPPPKPSTPKEARERLGTMGARVVMPPPRARGAAR